MLQVIVDFTATWCGPCRMIAPVFEELSTQFPTLVFLKVDVDEVEVSALVTACLLQLKMRGWWHRLPWRVDRDGWCACGVCSEMLSAA